MPFFSEKSTYEILGQSLYMKTAVRHIRSHIFPSVAYVSYIFFQILFLNKVDLFQDKIRHSGRHLRYFFPSFTGKIHNSFLHG